VVRIGQISTLTGPCGFPWLTIQVGLELTRAHLALGEAAAARTVFTEVEQVL
jgi:hypothetical protein